MRTLVEQAALLLLCCGFHLIQAMPNSTVMPPCNSSEPANNCTTSLAPTDSPRVAPVVRTSCVAEMQSYCFHGECVYLVDLNESSCQCELGYVGKRCEHAILTVQQPLGKEYLALTILLILFFLASVAGALYYFCRWYQNRKGRNQSKHYKQVTTRDKKNPALLQV
ncbi:proepiregulin [Tachyglossus aculeatus]|uniref:proepiregulin n=1 Tax=Tachyglossus aculeatus TaxID=9261 RepID=UPI0018F5850F|nr:proepiregulin [Tachyglossus aculeatus]